MFKQVVLYLYSVILHNNNKKELLIDTTTWRIKPDPKDST